MHSDSFGKPFVFFLCPGSPTPLTFDLHPSIPAVFVAPAFV